MNNAKCLDKVARNIDIHIENVAVFYCRTPTHLDSENNMFINSKDIHELKALICKDGN